MFYRITKWLLAPVLRWYFGLEVEGEENVPRRGPVILASNHGSSFDSWLVPLALRRRVTYVARDEYFDRWYTAWLFRAWGQIPLRPDGRPASEAALRSALDVLEGGGVFGIYPEGSPSPDGRLYKGHVGVARVAIRSGAPVVPVGIRGSFEAARRGRIPRRGQVTIRFGRPLDLRAHARSEGERLALRAATDEVVFEIRELTGQTYVNRYAARETEVGESIVPARLGAPA